MKTRKMLSKYEAVYAVYCDGEIKIGSASKCVFERMKSKVGAFKRHLEKKGTLLGWYEIEGGASVKCEKAIHTFLKEERVEGEWFKINLEQLHNAFGYAKFKHNIIGEWHGMKLPLFFRESTIQFTFDGI